MTRKFLGTVMCLLLLSGCSWIEDWPPWDESSNTLQSSSSNVRVVQSPGGTWVDSLPSVAAAPVQAVSSRQQNADLDDEALTRITRLENSVEEMRSVIEKMLPALSSLAGLEGQLQKTLSGISPASGDTVGNVMQQTYPDYGQAYRKTAVPPPLKPQPLAAVAAQPSRKQPSSYEQHVAKPVKASFSPPAYKSNIQQVRIGVHPQKTRMVLDADGDITYSYSLNNGGRLLMLELSGVGWNVKNLYETRPDSLVESYVSQSMGKNGTRLLIQMKEPVSVLWADKLMSSAGQSSRLVLDLGRS